MYLYTEMITSATLDAIIMSYQLPVNGTSDETEKLANLNIMNETMVGYLDNLHDGLANASEELEQLESDMDARRDLVSDALVSLLDFIGQDRQAALDDLNTKMSDYYKLIEQVHDYSSFAADSAESLLSELWMAEQRHNTSRNTFNGINDYILTVERKIQLLDEELSGLDMENISVAERQARQASLMEELNRTRVAEEMQTALLSDTNCETEKMSQIYEAATGINNAIDNYRTTVLPLAQVQLEDFMMKRQQNPIEQMVITQLRSIPNRPRDVSLNDSKCHTSAKGMSDSIFGQE